MDAIIALAMVVLGSSPLAKEYLRRFASMIVEAVQGSICCLDFLNGKKGTFEGCPSDKSPDWIEEVIRAYWEAHPQVDPYSFSFNWEEGKISFAQANPKTGCYKPVEMRLGKWLRKAGATPEQIKEFETRTLDNWEWRVSTDWRDILTMSHNRPWTSCMRPGGCHEEGPITDIWAGSALLFWHRPGADVPCGREILRPALIDGRKTILRSATVYGSGPYISDTELADLLDFPVLTEGLTCAGVIALWQNVYDDCDRQSFHDQDEFQENLRLLDSKFLKMLLPVTEEDFWGGDVPAFDGEGRLTDAEIRRRRETYHPDPRLFYTTDNIWR